MSLLSDENIAKAAAIRQKVRVKTAGTKLNSHELAALEEYCRTRGTSPGEFIRQLILRELAAGSEAPRASAELTEIVGLRLMLANLLEPLATGQKLTPHTVESIMAEVKKRKGAVAVEVQNETERV